MIRFPRTRLNPDGKPIDQEGVIYCPREVQVSGNVYQFPRVKTGMGPCIRFKRKAVWEENWDNGFCGNHQWQTDIKLYGILDSADISGGLCVSAGYEINNAILSHSLLLNANNKHINDRYYSQMFLSAEEDPFQDHIWKTCKIKIQASVDSVQDWELSREYGEFGGYIEPAESAQTYFSIPGPADAYHVPCEFNFNYCEFDPMLEINGNGYTGGSLNIELASGNNYTLRVINLSDYAGSFSLNFNTYRKANYYSGGYYDRAFYSYPEYNNEGALSDENQDASAIGLRLIDADNTMRAFYFARNRETTEPWQIELGDNGGAEQTIDLEYYGLTAQLMQLNLFCFAYPNVQCAYSLDYIKFEA